MNDKEMTYLNGHNKGWNDGFKAGRKSMLADIKAGTIDIGDIIDSLCQESIMATRKAAIKEVVGWFKEHSYLEQCDPDTEAYFDAYRWISKEEWQDYLKELGIKE